MTQFCCSASVQFVVPHLDVFDCSLHSDSGYCLHTCVFCSCLLFISNAACPAATPYGPPGSTSIASCTSELIFRLSRTSPADQCSAADVWPLFWAYFGQGQPFLEADVMASSSSFFVNEERFWAGAAGNECGLLSALTFEHSANQRRR